MNNLAVLIPQHLKLDVPRTLQKTLRVHVWIAKGLLGFTASRLIRGEQFALVANDAHSAASSSSYRFKDQRIPYPRRLLAQLLFAFHNPLASGNRREPRSFHLAPRAILFSHHLDHFGSRPDESNFGSLAHFREISVLGKKSVTRVDGIDIGDFRGANDLRNIQIAFAAARRADAYGFVGKL